MMMNMKTISTTNCISGDAKIPFLKIKKVGVQVKLRTFNDLYDEWNYISETGRRTKREYILQRKTRVFDCSSETFEVSRVEEILFCGNKELFQIQTANGKSLKLTEDHKILTKTGFLPVRVAVGLFHNGFNWDIQKDCYVMTIPQNKTKLKEFSRITKINHAGIEPVYNISITHSGNNFVANEIVVHV